LKEYPLAYGHFLIESKQAILLLVRAGIQSLNEERKTMLKKIDIIYLYLSSQSVSSLLIHKRCLLVDFAADAKLNFFLFNANTKTLPLKKSFFFHTSY
jgi:hypothetical protein